MSRSTAIVGTATLAAGLAASLHSLRETIGHVRDPAYRDVDVSQGAGHVSYHLAREALTTSGALAAAVPAAIGALRGHRSGWFALSACTGGYLAGQWSGKRTAGRYAPTPRALAWHVATSVLLAGGTMLLRPGGAGRRHR